MYQTIPSFGTRRTLLRYGNYQAMVRKVPQGGILATKRWYREYLPVVSYMRTVMEKFLVRGDRGNNCLCFLIIERLTLILHAQIGERNKV